MRRLTAAIVFLVVSGPSAAGQAPYSLRWGDAVSAAAAGDPNSQRSFPSGHASIAFAAATSYVVMAQREHLPHRGRNAALLYVGALGVAALRVAAGKHFPTDVLGGAVLGTGIGWLAAKVHPTEP